VKPLYLWKFLPGPIPSWNVSILVGQDGILFGGNGSTRPVPEHQNLIPRLVLELDFDFIPYSSSVFTTWNKHWQFYYEILLYLPNTGIIFLSKWKAMIHLRGEEELSLYVIFFTLRNL
jgi:hypothetical protein